ncbi:presenilin family intramembrane aspartyl protease [Nanoarchaeota archaeon]
MKHNLKITFILLGMFLITQFIGLYVINHYSQTKIIDGQEINVTAPELPYGMETPDIEKESDYYGFFTGILIAFVIAISILFLLTKFKSEIIIKIWFFIVVIVALGITFNSILPQFKYVAIISAVIALPLAYIKIFKKEFLIHNLTELFIYPGIAAVFVPILNLWTIIILLILISLYDMWAVWHSGIMQKMAKYQIDKLNIFSGFFVPYMSKKLKKKIKQMKKSKAKKQKIKVNIAILGGGDVIFPIITAGVVMQKIGLTTVAGIALPIASLFVILGATLGLSYLFFFAEKKKFYPAMPFITAGIFLGMLLAWALLN